MNESGLGKLGRQVLPEPPSVEGLRLAYAEAGKTIYGAHQPLDEVIDELPKVSTGSGSYI
jgi:hypothetical protein